MLSDVNSICGTNYGCGICHVDPKGGGPLTAGGTAYVRAGNAPCSFCPTDPDCTTSTCTDADADSYYAESGCGTAVDCNPRDASVHPGSAEVCTGGVDDNCDGKVDCADAGCAADPACTAPGLSDFDLSGLSARYNRKTTAFAIAVDVTMVAGGPATLTVTGTGPKGAFTLTPVGDVTLAGSAAYNYSYPYQGPGAYSFTATIADEDPDADSRTARKTLR